MLKSKKHLCPSNERMRKMETAKLAEEQQTEKTALHYIKQLAVVSGNLLSIALLLVMLGLTFFLLRSHFTGVPMAAGHHLYIVSSGSMSPTIDTGSIVIVQPQTASEITAGDIITYRLPGGDNHLITHLVVDVNNTNGLHFITKGDANETADLEPVPANNIVGKTVFSLPYAGYVINFAQTTTGYITIFIVPALLIIAFETRNLIRYTSELDKQKKKEKVKRKMLGTKTKAALKS
jgi:signal peptidase